MSEPALLKEQQDHVLILRLNRPEKKNALNNVMMNELNYALAYAKQEREIRVVVVDAEGDIFCAGADLRLAKEDSNVPKIEGADDISFSLRRLHKPVICKIQGSVLAGALLILTNATHAIAVDNAKFSAPEIHRGLWPFMVMAGLFRVMPKRAGLDFIMRGQPIDANKAEIGGSIYLNGTGFAALQNTHINGSEAPAGAAISSSENNTRPLTLNAWPAPISVSSSAVL